MQAENQGFLNQFLQLIWLQFAVLLGQEIRGLLVLEVLQDTDYMEGLKKWITLQALLL